MNIEKKFRHNELLSKHTHYKIGGPADFFIEAESNQELKQAVAWAVKKKIPYTLLGGGSNVLVLDSGIRGLVIKTANKEMKIRKTELTVASGVVLINLINQLADRGWAGLEFGCGIYGTVGGAVYGNAGSFGREIKDVLLQTLVYDPLAGEKILSTAECKFSYRSSIFKEEKNYVILSAVFNLEKDDPAVIKGRIKEMLGKKIASQPMDLPSSGCIFKNPILDQEKFKELKNHFSQEYGQAEFWQTNSIAAGFLIERSGLKGRRLGDAEVSEKHAAFIVNRGKATAEQVIMLISLIKQQVRDKYGVQLQEEIEILGE